MSYSNGRITGNVEVRDVQLALGTTINDVGLLCAHQNINIASRYKPVRDTINGKAVKKEILSDDDFYDRDWGFAIPCVDAVDASLFNSMIISISTGQGYIWDTDLTYGRQDEDNIGNGWYYLRPESNANFHRITDFANYDHRMNMEEKTFLAHDSLKLMSKPSGYNPKFTVKMYPFGPGNFASLIGSYLGIAFYIPELSANSPYVRFWVDSTVITKSFSNNMVELSVPTEIFNSLLSNINSRYTDCTIYAVCFLNRKGGINNISGSGKPGELWQIRPIFGNCVDIMLYKYIAGTGENDRMLLAFTMSQITTVIEGSKQDILINLDSVTNNYDTTSTIYLYPQYLMYTTEVYSSQGILDNTRSRTNRAYFTSSTGAINISNTQASGGVVTHKTTTVNIEGVINLNGQPAPEEGSYIILHLWYMTYNSEPTSQNYRKGGMLRINVRKKNFTPTPFD